MKIEIRELHIHAHIPASVIANFTTLLENIMSNQAELAAQIEAVTAVVTKVGGETQSLLTKIEELTAAVVAAGNVSPEVAAAMTALQDQANVVDALVADVPATDPAATDPGIDQIVA